MKISELVESLKHIKEEHGDLDVVVQYRDDGGIYPGYDTDCEPIIKRDEVNDSEVKEIVVM